MLERRWTLEMERMAAAEIRDAERRAREALVGVEVAEEILAARRGRDERTRAAAVGRLAAAVHATRAAAEEQPELKPRAERAAAAWAEAEALCWKMAMSARRVVEGEVRKLINPLVALEDLTQEGYIGLLNAAQRFDPDRGIRFSTYARWWVRAQMTRAIEQTGRMVRLPGGAVEQLRNLRLAADRLSLQTTGDDVGELARHTGVLRRRADLLLSTGTWVSLDQPDSEGLGVLERLAPEHDLERRPDVVADREQSLRRLRAGLDGLVTVRERYVLARRFGLDELETTTVADIGALLGVSRERVRQIEHNALDRLREGIHGREEAVTARSAGAPGRPPGSAAPARARA